MEAVQLRDRQVEVGGGFGVQTHPPVVREYMTAPIQLEEFSMLNERECHCIFIHRLSSDNNLASGSNHQCFWPTFISRAV